VSAEKLIACETRQQPTVFSNPFSAVRSMRIAVSLGLRRNCRTRRPKFRAAAAVSAVEFAGLSLITTSAPERASAMLIAAPMPVAAPVISPILSAKLNGGCAKDCVLARETMAEWIHSRPAAKRSTRTRAVIACANMRSTLHCRSVTSPTS